MKYIFETEDEEEAQTLINATAWKVVVWNFDQYLRSEYRYNDVEKAEEYREKLREFMNEYNLNLDS
jgi:adenylosuccinate synthase